MDQGVANPVLYRQEVRELQVLIQQRSGIVFDESREHFLTTRVLEHMRRKGVICGVELLRRVTQSIIEYDSLLERLLTQETSFLRYPALFSAFAEQVVPELLARKAAVDVPPGLRILSAGCATGEEPYSIAISLCEMAAVGKETQASIQAVDVSREALERATRGIYRGRSLENLSPVQLGCYFSRSGEEYAVKPMLREMVTFMPMNLAQPAYLGRFDCIFCMNVLIYFNAELRCSLIERFYKWLEPGGYLFLGHAESVADVPVKFQQRFANGARLLQKPLQLTLALAEATR